MKHNVLSYSLVGVWATPLPGIPRLSPHILKNLFEDPYATNVGFAQDGSVVVQKMAKPPAPMMLFGTTKVQVQTPTVEQTARVFGIAIQEAYDQTNQQIPLFAQIGLNTEHEWIRPSFNPSNRWLGERYVRRGLFQPPLDIVTEAITIHFNLVLANPPSRFNIQLQPRAEMGDGVFAAVNDHREWHTALPSQQEVAALLTESANRIVEHVTPLILGGVVENA